MPSRAHDGLEHARTRSPDCVLLDFVLPDMDGLDLAAALLALECLSSSWRQRGDVPETVDAYEAGCAGVRSKFHVACHPHELIRNAMERSTMHQQSAAQTTRWEGRPADPHAADRTDPVRAARKRKRIAQLLHDHLQQLLYGVQMRIHIRRGPGPRGTGQ
ncbi:MAG: hypothetical protein R2851_02930 [Caldilineaceae bacterium]